MTLDAERGQANVGRPASGAYGEKADVERLKRQLPDGGNQGPLPQTQETQPVQSGPPTGVTQVAGTPGAPQRPDTLPPGVPSALVAPNQQDIPVPLDAPGQMGVPADPMANLPPEQKTIAMLDMLANSPQVSNETREWATTVLDILFQ